MSEFVGDNLPPSAANFEEVSAYTKFGIGYTVLSATVDSGFAGTELILTDDGRQRFDEVNFRMLIDHAAQSMAAGVNPVNLSSEREGIFGRPGVIKESVINKQRPFTEVELELSGVVLQAYGDRPQKVHLRTLHTMNWLHQVLQDVDQDPTDMVVSAQKQYGAVTSTNSGQTILLAETVSGRSLRELEVVGLPGEISAEFVQTVHEHTSRVLNKSLTAREKSRINDARNPRNRHHSRNIYVAGQELFTTDESGVAHPRYDNLDITVVRQPDQRRGLAHSIRRIQSV